MKRLVSMFLCMLLVPMYALADVDLSGMTYDELVALKDKINLALWQSDEWQEVEVPQGIWVVGEDIPVGKWTIRHTDGVSNTYVIWSDAIDASGASLSYSGKLYESERVYDPDNKYYDKGNPTEVTWDLKEGQYLMVSDGIATFTPYSGKPSLGFK